MAMLIKKFEVPRNVRKFDSYCPDTVSVYSDRVESTGIAGRKWFFSDYTGIDWAPASVFCAYSGVRFLNNVNSGSVPLSGTAMLSDKNRVNFCSGTFSYKPANDYAYEVYKTIKSAFEEYKKSPQPAKKQSEDVHPTSAADEIKKFKELLDSGIITQEEFDAKKKQLLGL